MAAKAKTTKPIPSTTAQPRLRVLAGANGSGKSTIKSELKPQWIGVFVNADEIEREFKVARGFLDLRQLGIGGEAAAALKRIKRSLQTFGLEEKLDLPALLSGLTLDDAMRLWVPAPHDSYLAAALAEAIRQELLAAGRTFTFETVMSHPSKIEFMKEARARGYRVYLYFVATDDPDINIDRVRRRATACAAGRPPGRRRQGDRAVPQIDRSDDPGLRGCRSCLHLRQLRLQAQTPRRNHRLPDDRTCFQPHQSLVPAHRSLEGFHLSRALTCMFSDTIH